MSLRYSGLSNIGMGVLGQLRHKFGLGAEAPWAALTAQGLDRDYNYQYRTGWQYDAAATLGKQFGDRWHMSARVSYDQFVASQVQRTVRPGLSTAAYDVSGWTVWAKPHTRLPKPTSCPPHTPGATERSRR